MNEKFIILGIGLILAGFFVLFVGILMSVISGEEKGVGNFRGGGVIMIGPIPIGFGTDKEMMILAIVLAIVLMIIAFIFLKFFKFV